MLTPSVPGASRINKAFTLLEMVVVMAIVATIIAVATPAMSGIVGATNLTSAGNMVSNLAAQARQVAMTRNTVSALAVLGELGEPEDYRMLAIMEYDAGSGWKQATPWQSLPNGVLVDFTNRDTCTFLKNGVPLAMAPADAATGRLPFQYNGTTLTSSTCALRVFLPNGGLHDSESPARIRLVEGVKQGTGLDYSHQTDEGAPRNYYDVSIIGATGLAKINRP